MLFGLGTGLLGSKAMSAPSKQQRVNPRRKHIAFRLRRLIFAPPRGVTNR
ncbi:hypothetical protein H0921_16940 [thermophilic bacterium 2918]|uniref:Uncharacterized protein n=2 Tax=Thermogemmata fonticola TaxID=2755323 RepID=A0A7V8VGY0_9BACT|nr:hypothetical protein [Thermogemmata fonticola]